MKDQYFGDINDYRKYGLLRAIINAGDFRLMVAWMLTPDDGSKDGKRTSYLDCPTKLGHHDPELFHTIKKLLANDQKRQVKLIENSDLLQKVNYFSDTLKNSAPERSSWFDTLIQKSRESNFVFLDPDNGLEVKSREYGRKNSSKYLYWHEVQTLWTTGKSLLIYQHFPFEKRHAFIPRILVELQRMTPGSLVDAFSTPHVVFLMALQPTHHETREAIVRTVQQNWKGQIQPWDR